MPPPDTAAALLVQAMERSTNASNSPQRRFAIASTPYHSQRCAACFGTREFCCGRFSTNLVTRESVPVFAGVRLLPPSLEGVRPTPHFKELVTSSLHRTAEGGGRWRSGCRWRVEAAATWQQPASRQSRAASGPHAGGRRVPRPACALLRAFFTYSLYNPLF